MKGVRVQYTVKPEYVEQNQANIKAVMEDLRNNPIAGLSYSSYYLGDGKFMHVSVSSGENDGPGIGDREKFKHFRVSLKESGPLAPPESEKLELVGSNK